MGKAHEVDYQIYGDDMQLVAVELDPEESAIAEAGAMMAMESSIEMETVFGDGKQGQSLFSKLLGAGKRLITGESLFLTVFTNKGRGKQQVYFSAPYPGKIIPIDLKQVEEKIICQKDSFLCAARGVSIGIEFQRKIGVGFFGGEGFIMQKVEGDGMVFLHAGGTILERTLAPGELIKIDTGCLVAMTKTIEYDIQMVKGVKSMLFGGEGLFFATLRGPGRVWLQSLPFSRLADRIAAVNSRTGGRREEGSVLGSIGDLIDGDD